jgi:hypothetical protein
MNAFRSITASLVVALAVAGCAAGKSSVPEPAAAGGSLRASKPDASLTVKHLKEHVKYPASRAVVLAACADTPEFSADEKKWLADNLPERNYASAEEVANALRL